MSLSTTLRPLPLYTLEYTYTESRCVARRSLPSDSFSLLSLSVVIPRVLCCQHACKMVSSDRHRSLCSAFKSAKDSLPRHFKLGSFRALQKSVPMGSFIAVILLAIADSDAA